MLVFFIVSMLHQNGLYGNMLVYWLIAVPSFMGAWWIIDKLDKKIKIVENTKKEVSPVSTSPKELKRKLTVYLLIKKWNGLP